MSKFNTFRKVHAVVVHFHSERLKRCTSKKARQKKLTARENIVASCVHTTGCMLKGSSTGQGLCVQESEKAVFE